MDEFEDFVNDLKYALENWRYSHGTFEGFMEQIVNNAWSLLECYEDDAIYFNIGDSYHRLVNQVIADEEAEDYLICHGEDCGSLYHITEVLDYNRCPECGKFMATMLPSDYLDIMNYDLNPSDDQLEAGLMLAFEQFNKYWPALVELCEDIDQALHDIDNADSPEELLAAVLYACHCSHIGGTISIDYGNVDWNDIDTISNEGFEALWDIEDIHDYLGI